MIEFLPPPKTHDESRTETVIRKLDLAEWEQLSPIFQERNDELPDPNLATILAAFKDGKIVSFIVLQLKLHCEPIYVMPDHSDTFLPLINNAKVFIGSIIQKETEVWFRADNENICSMASHLGFELTENVFCRNYRPGERLLTIQTIDEICNLQQSDANREEKGVESTQEMD